MSRPQNSDGVPRPGLDEATLLQLEAGYVCPPGAGPGWRAAAEAGMDMALLEHSLALDPWGRLEANQRALHLVLALERAGQKLRRRDDDE